MIGFGVVIHCGRGSTDNLDAFKIRLVYVGISHIARGTAKDEGFKGRFELKAVSRQQ